MPVLYTDYLRECEESFSRISHETNLTGEIKVSYCDHASLRRGITEANTMDTVIVAAGNYVQTETLIIDKALRIFGKQADIDARNRSVIGIDTTYNFMGGYYDKSESTITASGLDTIIHIKRSNVLLNGLTITQMSSSPNIKGIEISNDEYDKNGNIQYSVDNVVI
jgi:hypothetical protein